MIIISLLFDGILSIIIPLSSPFIPNLTLISLYSYYILNRKNKEKFLFSTTLLGLAYDLLYTNKLFLHAILFFIIAKLIILIYNNFPQSPFHNIIYTIFIITIYNLLIAIILYVFRITPISIMSIKDRILNSLIINVVYSEILYLFITHKKTSKRISYIKGDNL